MHVPPENIIALTRTLCAYKTGVVVDDNEALFARIAQEVPLTVYRYPTGSSFNGWLIPQKWIVNHATISRNGHVVFDGRVNSLAVASYSHSFQGKLTLGELKQHLVTYPERPDAVRFHCMWQYRPWAPGWAFCIPFRLYETLEEGIYEIDLQTTYSDGEMLVGVSTFAGTSDKTIVLNAHTCHPHMANDGMVGVATAIRLAQFLFQKPHYYTYQLVFGPEHLGTVFYLKDRSREELERFVSGIFIEMTGVNAPLLIPSTFLGNQTIDRAIANSAKHYVQKPVFVPWRQGAGNDETVWEAPGYEVPFVELTRFLIDGVPYPEYHTNDDTAESLVPKMVDEVTMLLEKTIFVLENNATIQRKFNGLICLSNPENNLYMERPDPAVSKVINSTTEQWGILQDSLFRYFDGKMTILDIAEKHGVPFDELSAYLKKIESRGYIQLHFKEIERHPFEWLDSSGITKK